MYFLRHFHAKVLQRRKQVAGRIKLPLSCLREKTGNMHRYMCGGSGNPRTLFFSNPDAKASSLSIKLFGDQNCNNLVGGGGGRCPGLLCTCCLKLVLQMYIVSSVLDS